MILKVHIYQLRHDFVYLIRLWIQAIVDVEKEDLLLSRNAVRGVGHAIRSHSEETRETAATREERHGNDS